MNIQGDNELFAFLTSAPKEFVEGERIRKYQLKNGDFIHCVLWKNHFYITGTDIVKILIWRFQNANRSLGSLKKFEEGIFSDLRNLKPGVDATLENPRSEFLEFLYKNGCIRTQKKQKVFFWYSVPHDSLFCDALERDLRRENNLAAYGKYMNETGNQYFPEDLKLHMSRKIYKTQRLAVRPPKPIYDQHMHAAQYETKCGADKNLVKSLLFNTAPAHSAVTKQKFSQTFMPPFPLSELDNVNIFNEHCDMFGMPDEYPEPRKFKKSPDSSSEILGQKSNETYPMPNIQGSFQK